MFNNYFSRLSGLKFVKRFLLEQAFNKERVDSSYKTTQVETQVQIPTVANTGPTHAVCVAYTSFLI